MPMFDHVEKLKEFIHHPSVSTDSNFREGMRGAREFVARLLSGMGLQVEVVQTATHPIILAERPGEASWPHVVIYGHYDVQPADPLNLWQTPPFEATIRGNRIYGRGAADNKGPLLANIAAVARLLEKDPRIPLRITFLIEGEEEMGSPSFPAFLEKYKERFRKADFVYLSDTALPNENQVVITCGLRGLALMDLHVTGAKMDLHSGLHGGVLRNPIQALAEICATLHTPDGRVNVPGFYDGVLDVEPWERAELKKLGADEAAYAGFPRYQRISHASGLVALRGGAVRADPGVQRNRGRLPGGGDEDGDSEQGLREDQLPARAKPESGDDQAPAYRDNPRPRAEGREDKLCRPAPGRDLRRRSAGPLKHPEGPAAHPRPCVQGG